MLGALRSLQRLVSAHPLQLLKCSSLPLLVHAAVRKVYARMGSNGNGKFSSMSTMLGAAEVQAGVSGLLCVVRQAAQQATSPAAAAARAMWQLWEQHPPASLAKAVAGGAAVGGGISGAWDRMAAAAGLMGSPGSPPLPAVPSYAGYAGYAAGGLGGGAVTAAGVQRLVAELVHASDLMGELSCSGGCLPA